MDSVPIPYRGSEAAISWNLTSCRRHDLGLIYHVQPRELTGQREDRRIVGQWGF